MYKKRGFKKALAFLMSLLLLLLAGSTAYAEITWYCPQCGQENHDNFCSRDGTRRPDLAEEDVSPDSASGPVIPVFSDMFSPSNGHLKLLGDENERAYSFAGPGKGFADSGGYKPWKQAQVTTYFNENGWILADIVYATAEERFVYLAKWNFDETGNIPEIEPLQGYEGTIITATDPSWGPGSKYNTVPLYHANAGTRITVFFQENGYAFGEYASPQGRARMWFPADHVEVPGMTLFLTAETNQTGNKSDFGRQSVYAEKPEDADSQENIINSLPVGTWSDWSLTPYEASENIEVETRNVYRVKHEIEDWSDWIDGDPPGDTGYPIETRVVTGENGESIPQWREYWYHYHYGEWSDWYDEGEWAAGVGSSADIVEHAVLYRCRRIQ